MISLETLNPGELGMIMKIGHCGGCGGGCHGHDNDSDRAGQGAGTTRAEEIGLRAGKMVEIMNKDGNLVMLQVDDELITIDRRMALNIMVQVENQKLSGTRQGQLR